MIKIKKHTYNKEADATYFEFSDRKVYRTREQAKGIIIDYDKAGFVVGIEILNAAKIKNITFGFVIPKKVIRFSAGQQKFQLPVLV